MHPRAGRSGTSERPRGHEARAGYPLTAQPQAERPKSWADLSEGALGRGLSVNGASESREGGSGTRAAREDARHVAANAAGDLRKRFMLSLAKGPGPRSSKLRQTVDRLREAEAQSTNP